MCSASRKIRTRSVMSISARAPGTPRGPRRAGRAAPRATQDPPGQSRRVPGSHGERSPSWGREEVRRRSVWGGALGFKSARHRATSNQLSRLGHVGENPVPAISLEPTRRLSLLSSGLILSLPIFEQIGNSCANYKNPKHSETRRTDRPFDPPRAEERRRPRRARAGRQGEIRREPLGPHPVAQCTCCVVSD
jgi:hypothetical protein